MMKIKNKVIVEYGKKEMNERRCRSKKSSEKKII